MMTDIDKAFAFDSANTIERAINTIDEEFGALCERFDEIPCESCPIGIHKCGDIRRMIDTLKADFSGLGDRCKKVLWNKLQA